MMFLFGVMAAANMVVVINGAADGRLRWENVLAAVVCGAAAWKWRK